MVSFARGDRDYIRSVDMIEVAPIGDGLDSFRFRFFVLAKSPGRWLPLSGTPAPEGAFAELQIGQGDDKTDWYFACPDPSVQLESIEDEDFRFDPGSYALDGHVVHGPLQTGVSFWTQLIEVIRHAGTLVVPDKEWLIGSISGDAACFEPVSEGTELRIDMRRATYKRVVAPFSTSAGAVGRIVAMPKPDED